MVSRRGAQRRRNGRHADVSASRHACAGYTARTVPIAVIAFDFDPLLRLGDGLVVRWQTVALAAVIAACLIVAGVLGAPRRVARGRPAVHRRRGRARRRRSAAAWASSSIAPDAFAGGPLTRARSRRSAGSSWASASSAGCCPAAYVARLLGAPVGRWATTLALPLLVAIGAGKLAMALGGSGQGSPLDAAWATAYLGPGPWGSLAPALPSHPAQLYEGLGHADPGAAPRWSAGSAIGSGARDGRLLLSPLAGWAAIRAVVSVTWRDPVVLGPFPAGGVLAGRDRRSARPSRSSRSRVVEPGRRAPGRPAWMARTARRGRIRRRARSSEGRAARGADRVDGVS